MSYPRSRLVRPRARRPIQATAGPRSRRGLGAPGMVPPGVHRLGDADLGNAFTDFFTQPIYVPGVTGSPEPVHYNAWRASVLKRTSWGVTHQVARFPSGPSAGKWAEKYWDAGPVGKAQDPVNGGVWRYANAPQTVWDEDDAIGAFNAKAASVLAVPGQILTNVAALPRKTIGAALGIPQWLIPVIALTGAAVVVRAYLPKG